MGSKGRASNHRPTGIQNSFLTEMENVVVLIESMRNIVMESPQNMFLCLLSKLKHRSGLFLDPHCRASLNCVKNMTLTKKNRGNCYCYWSWKGVTRVSSREIRNISRFQLYASKSQEDERFIPPSWSQVHKQWELDSDKTLLDLKWHVVGSAGRLAWQTNAFHTCD